MKKMEMHSRINFIFGVFILLARLLTAVELNDIYSNVSQIRTGGTFTGNESCSNNSAVGSHAQTAGMFATNDTYLHFTGDADTFSKVLELPPPPVRNPSYVVVNATNVILSWTKPVKGSLDIAGYKVYKAQAYAYGAITNIDSYSLIGNCSGELSTSYTDTINAGDMNAYYICSIDSDNEQSTNNATITVGHKIYAIVTNLTGISYILGSRSVNLSWQFSEAGISQYFVYRRPLTGGYFVSCGATAVKSLMDKSVDTNSSYEYRIEAANNLNQRFYLGTKTAHTIKGIAYSPIDVLQGGDGSTVVTIMDASGSTNVHTDNIPFSIAYVNDVGLVDGVRSVIKTTDTNGRISFNFNTTAYDKTNTIRLYNSDVTCDIPVISGLGTIYATIDNPVIWKYTTTSYTSAVRAYVKYAGRSWTNIIVTYLASNGFMSQNGNGTVTVFTNKTTALSNTYAMYSGRTNSGSVFDTIVISSPAATNSVSISVKVLQVPESVPEVKGYPIPDAYLPDNFNSVWGEITDPINKYTGNLQYEIIDTRIASPGFPINVRRRYNSLNPEAGAFGYGWICNFNERLFYTNRYARTDALFLRNDGAMLQFTNLGIVNGTNQYGSAYGCMDRLWISNDFHRLELKNGGSYVFDSAGNKIAILLKNRSISFTYDTNSRLTKVNDDASGASILFSYYSNTLFVSNVTGPINDKYFYFYDSSTNLISVTGPDYTSTYTYNTNHGLTSIRDPKAPASMKTRRYEYAENNMVIKDIDGNTNIKYFGYDIENDHQIQYYVTSFYDDFGRSNKTYFNTNGYLDKKIDPLNGCERYEYANKLNLTRYIDKNGGRHDYGYNYRFNLMAKKDPEGGISKYNYVYTYQVLLDRVYNASNGMTAYTYDNNANLTKITYPDNSVEEYTYDANYQMLTSVDRNKNTLTYEYDAYGNIKKITYPKPDYLAQNPYVEYTYDALGRRTSVRDMNGNITTYTYNGLSEITNIRYSDNTSVVHSYDSLGRLTNTRDELTNNISYKYDAYDNIVETIDELKYSRKKVIGKYNVVLSQIDPATNVTAYVYDDLFRVAAITNALGHFRLLSYDSNGNILSIVNENEAAVRYEYTSNNLVKRVVNTNNLIHEYQYDSLSRLFNRIDPDKYTNTDNYNTVGRVTNRIDRNGNIETITYDDNGNVKAIEDKCKRITSFQYDVLNRLIKVTDPLLHFSTMEYDANGNLTKYVNANNERTLYYYDSRNRLIRKVDPLDYEERYAYDVRGLLTNVTDRWNKKTSYVYDAKRRLISVIFPNTTSNTFSYDANGNKLSYRDGNGNTIRYEYDALQRVVRVLDPISRPLMQYSYDKLGRVTNIINGNNIPTGLKYDDVGQLVEIRHKDETSRYFGYDLVGRRTNVINEAGYATSYYYDPAGRLLRVVDALTNTNAYAYDAVGNILAETNALGKVSRYEYDHMNRVVTKWDALQGISSYTYDNVGRLTSETDPLLYATVIEYDPLGRIKKTRDKNNKETQISYAVAANNVTVTDAMGGETTFVYDAMNRLASITNAMSGVKTYVYDKNNNVLAETNESGFATRYAYDILNRLIALTNAMTNRIEYVYDGVGNVTNIRGFSGARTTYEYNYRNMLSKIIDASNNVTQFAYRGDGIRTLINDPMSNSTSFGLDPLGRIISITNACTNVTRFSYDAIGNVVGIIDGSGVPVSFQYDELNRRIKEEDVYGDFSQIGYDAASRITSTTDKRGNTTSYSYDGNGNVVRITDPLLNATEYEYDALNRKKQLKNALNQLTIYDYDALSRLKKVTYPDTTCITYTYNPVGDLTAFTNERAAGMRFTYDSIGRRVSMIDPFGSVTKYTYNSANDVVSVVDPLTNTTSYTYDSLGNRLRITDAETNTTTFRYNRNGALTNVVDPKGNSTRYALDPLGRVMAEIDALGRTNIYSFDSIGNITNITDKNGRCTSYQYDLLSRMTAKIDALTNVTRYAYDPNGNLIAMTNALGRVYTYTYDTLNRLVSEIDPLLMETTYSYDQLSRVIEKNKPGSKFTYSYTARGNLERISQEISRGQAPGTPFAVTYPPVDYKYDETGAVTNISDTSIMLGYTRNPLGLITEQTVTMNGVTKGMTNVYNPVMLRITNIDFEGRTNTYVYDSIARLKQLTAQSIDYSALTNEFRYDRGSALTNIALANGIRTTITYDKLYNITSVLYLAATGKYIDKLTYGYDKVGNVTAITNREGYRKYTYDDIYQLTNARYADGTTESFTYDAMGNRLTHYFAGRQATNLAGYTYNDGNQLTMKVVSNANAVIQTINYSYNANGELKDRIAITAGTYVSNNIYNPLIERGAGGQLIGTNSSLYKRLPDGRVAVIESPESRFTNEYAYSPLLERMKKVEASGTNYYLYDGDNAVYVYNDDTLTNVVKHFIHSENIDTPLIVEVRPVSSGMPVGAGIRRYYHLADAQGNVRYLTDDKRRIVQKYEYTAFGVPAVFGDDTTIYTYTGRERDVDTGLYYYRSRMYDPHNGRFDRTDDIRSGDNWYAYCGNNPVTYKDPYGYNRNDGDFDNPNEFDHWQYTSVTTPRTSGSTTAAAKLPTTRAPIGQQVADNNNSTQADDADFDGGEIIVRDRRIIDNPTGPAYRDSAADLYAEAAWLNRWLAWIKFELAERDRAISGFDDAKKNIMPSIPGMREKAATAGAIGDIAGAREDVLILRDTVNKLSTVAGLAADYLGPEQAREAADFVQKAKDAYNDAVNAWKLSFERRKVNKEYARSALINMQARGELPSVTMPGDERSSLGRLDRPGGYSISARPWHSTPAMNTIKGIAFEAYDTAQGLRYMASGDFLDDLTSGKVNLGQVVTGAIDSTFKRMINDPVNYVTRIGGGTPIGTAASDMDIGRSVFTWLTFGLGAAATSVKSASIAARAAESTSSGVAAMNIARYETLPVGNSIKIVGNETKAMMSAGGKAKDVFDIVPAKYRKAVIRSFEETPKARTLKEDITVFQRRNPANQNTSPYFSKHYENPGNARKYQALPAHNTATAEHKYILKKGTTILEGKASSMVNVPGFGDWATGGGKQIYLPNPSDAILVK